RSVEPFFRFPWSSCSFAKATYAASSAQIFLTALKKPCPWTARARRRIAFPSPPVPQPFLNRRAPSLPAEGPPRQSARHNHFPWVPGSLHYLSLPNHSPSEGSNKLSPNPLGHSPSAPKKTPRAKLCGRFLLEQASN